MRPSSATSFTSAVGLSLPFGVPGHVLSQKTEGRTRRSGPLLTMGSQALRTGPSLPMWPWNEDCGLHTIYGKA